MFLKVKVWLQFSAHMERSFPHHLKSSILQVISMLLCNKSNLLKVNHVLSWNILDVTMRSLLISCHGQIFSSIYNYSIGKCIYCADRKEIIQE